MTLVDVGPAAPGFPVVGAALAGRDLVLVSRNLSPTRLAVVDTTTFQVTREVLVDRGEGAWGTTTAADGVWLGLFGARGKGNVLQLVGDTVHGRAALDTTYIWDLVAHGPDLYGVCTHPTLVFTMVRATGRARGLGIAAGGQSPRTVAVVGDRLVVAGGQGGKAWVHHSRLDGTDGRVAVPLPIAQDDTVYCSTATPDRRVVLGTAGDLRATPAVAVYDLSRPGDALVARLPREALVDTVAVQGDAVFATARPSGALYRVDLADGSVHRLAVPVPRAETREIFVSATRVLGVASDGSAWRYDRARDTVEVHSAEAMGIARRPQRPQAIMAARDRVDVGGSFSVTRHDPAGGPARTVDIPGEPKAIVDVDGTTYFAVYPIAEVWEWPRGADGPNRLTQLPTDQLRPIDLAHVPQLGALVVTTTDDRNSSGLHTIDPVTGRVDTVLEPLGPGQVASGLHVDATTCYVGGSGSAPAVGAFDLMTGERRWLVGDVAPGGGFVLGLQLVGDDLVVSTSGGWLARIDIDTRQVVQRRRAVDAAGRMVRAGNRLVWATGAQLLRVTPSTLATTVLADDVDAEVWNWPSLAADPLGRIWTFRGRDLVRE